MREEEKQASDSQDMSVMMYTVIRTVHGYLNSSSVCVGNFLKEDDAQRHAHQEQSWEVTCSVMLSRVTREAVSEGIKNGLIF